MDKRVQVNIKRRFVGDKDVSELILPIICEDLRKLLQSGTMDGVKKTS